MAKGVNIPIKGDSSSAEKAFKKVESAANSLNKKLKQTGAAAGRTEDEIKKIMSASIDIAASGLMSVDGAAASLNAT